MCPPPDGTLKDTLVGGTLANDIESDLRVHNFCRLGQCLKSTDCDPLLQAKVFPLHSSDFVHNSQGNQQAVPMLRCLLNNLEDRLFRVEKGGDIYIGIHHYPKKFSTACGIHR